MLSGIKSCLFWADANRLVINKSKMIEFAFYTTKVILSGLKTVSKTSEIEVR